jgi:hypothetical protein
MPGAFDPEMVNAFKKGIKLRDASLVEKAMEAGVQPDTPVNGMHPLYILLTGGYRRLPDAVRAQVSEDEFNQRTTAVVNTLFDHGARVAEEEKHATRNFETLADQLLLSDDLVDASTVVIHAIHETLQDGKPVYRIDPARAAAHLAQVSETQGVDLRAEANYVLGALEALHDVVRKRLENPRSETEQAVAAKMERLEAWQQPFKRPDMRMILTDPALLQKLLAQEGGQAGDAGLSRSFAAVGQRPENPFVTEIDARKSREIMAEIEGDFVGLDGLKRQARRLVFRQAYDAARLKEGLPAAGAKSHSAVITGNTGTGKSAFAHKEAELLVSLGLAGPKLVEITHEKAVGETISLQNQNLIALFQTADIILLEISGSTGGRPDTPDFSKRMLSALQFALESRADKPVVFLTGAADDVSMQLENAPGLQEFIGNYYAAPDMKTEQLCELLDKKLEKAGLTLSAEGREIVAQELDNARQKLGTHDFLNARAIDRIVDRLPDAVAERLFGQEEDEIKFISRPDKKALMTVTAGDIRALSLGRLLKGAQVTKRAGAGFGSDI